VSFEVALPVEVGTQIVGAITRGAAAQRALHIRQGLQAFVNAASSVFVASFG